MAVLLSTLFITPNTSHILMVGGMFNIQAIPDTAYIFREKDHLKSRKAMWAKQTGR